MRIWRDSAESSQTRGPPDRVAVLLDTSVLIAAEQGPDDDAAISVISLTELHFGVLVARDDGVRALRMRRLGAIEDHFDALPFDAAAARECGRLHALLAKRGGQPRRRAFDLAIAATANVHGVPLLTYNTKDFQILAEEIDIRTP
jgi:predicted nucleic acid-binding protein